MDPKSFIEDIENLLEVDPGSLSMNSQIMHEYLILVMELEETMLF